MKILVRATNWVGDAVMCIPALEAIRRRQPAAEVAVLARPWVADLYRGLACVDRAIPFEHKGRHAGIGGRERLAAELRREQFDVCILLQNAFEAAWIAWRAGIPERIGYARDARSWLLTRPIPLPLPGETPAHEAFYYLELLRRAGWLEVLPGSTEVRLPVAPEALDRAEKLLVDAGCRPGALRLAFATGAAYGTAKCWPAERYSALASRLIADYDADVVLFGSASESETAARVLRGIERGAVNLVGRSAIGDLPALLARCNAFLGNDSGAMHVAGAVGLPIVAVFGPTDPHGTAPLASQLTIVQKPVACSPCFLRHCPIDHRCMTAVSVEMVLEAARACLHGIAGSSGAR